MFNKTATCAACEAREATIAILKAELERVHDIRASERSEWKRSIDSILNKNGYAMIGQGLSPSEIPAPTQPIADNPINIFQDRGDPAN